MTTIAIISDTHDRLPWNLTEVIGRADVIFHAGDIGSQKVLDALHATAPVVYAVLGNTDEDPSVFTEDIPQAQLVEIDGVEFAIAHKPIDARETGKHTRLDRESVIINGHTHIPRDHWDMSMAVDNDGCPRMSRRPCGSSRELSSYSSIHRSFSRTYRGRSDRVTFRQGRSLSDSFPAAFQNLACCFRSESSKISYPFSY